MDTQPMCSEMVVIHAALRIVFYLCLKEVDSLSHVWGVVIPSAVKTGCCSLVVSYNVSNHSFELSRGLFSSLSFACMVKK
jgi:hypothetical protein